MPRAWALLFAELIGAELEPRLPADWLAAAEQRCGHRLTATLLGDSEPEVSDAERVRADAEGHQVVDQALMLLS